jgi:hypothetical protein
MANLTPEQSVLASRLTTFRPSDRQEIDRALRDPNRRRDVMRALISYVETWEKANWIEDYSIERIGKWFAISADKDFVVELSNWAKKRKTKARLALKAGLNKGRSMPLAARNLANRELAEI